MRRITSRFSLHRTALLNKRQRIFPSRFRFRVAPLVHRFAYEPVASAIVSSKGFLLMIDRLRQFPEAAKLILKSTCAVQLTEGCSIGCSFCGLNPKRKVGRMFPFSDLAFLVSTFKEELRHNRALFYWASDPLEWVGVSDRRLVLPGMKLESGVPLHYFHLHAFIQDEASYLPATSTSVPAGKEELAWEYRSSIDRLSLSNVNRKRLLRVLGEERLSRFYSIQEVPIHPELSLLQINQIRNTPLEESAWVRSGADPEAGIGSFDGGVIQPDQILNVLQIPRSQRYPEGQASVAIDLNLLTDRIPTDRPLSELLRYGVLRAYRPPAYTLPRGARPIVKFTLQNLVERREFEYVAASESLMLAA